MAEYILQLAWLPSHLSAPEWRNSAIVEHEYGPPTSAAVQVVGLACTYPGKQLNYVRLQL